MKHTSTFRNQKTKEYVATRVHDELTLVLQQGSYCNSDYGISLGRGSFSFDRGVWTRIAMYIQLNTLGNSDGVLRMFKNGNLVYSTNRVVYRVVPGLAMVN